MPMATKVCVNSITAKFGKMLARDAEKPTFEETLCTFIEMDIAKKHTKHVKLVMYRGEVLQRSTFLTTQMFVWSARVLIIKVEIVMLRNQ